MKIKILGMGCIGTDPRIECGEGCENSDSMLKSRK
jgi:hypothetical protein